MNSIISGEYPTMAEWKRLIKDKILKHDFKRFKVNCTLNRSLQHLNNNVNVSAISPLWIHCYKNINDFKKVKKCIQILIGSFRQLKGRCKLCNQAVFTLEHILFDCYILDISRSRLWNDVVNSGQKN